MSNKTVRWALVVQQILFIEIWLYAMSFGWRPHELVIWNFYIVWFLTALGAPFMWDLGKKSPNKGEQ